jgi:hypothetical protein
VAEPDADPQDAPSVSRGDAFRAVVANPRLRRIQLADLGSILGSWGFGVALAVWAFREAAPRSSA